MALRSCGERPFAYPLPAYLPEGSTWATCSHEGIRMISSANFCTSTGTRWRLDDRPPSQGTEPTPEPKSKSRNRYPNTKPIPTKPHLVSKPRASIGSHLARRDSTPITCRLSPPLTGRNHWATCQAHLLHRPHQAIHERRGESQDAL